ncbi:MAG: tetratricopeptide repeat protein [Planctomycetota bacterium]
MLSNPRALLVLLVCLAAAGENAQASEAWEWTESAGWSRSEGTAKGTAEEQFAYARSLEARGENYDAARQYFLLVRTFPNSPEANLAIIQLAEVLFKMENYYESFKTLEESIEKYPRSIHLPALLSIEYDIGKRLLKGAPVSLFQKDTPKRDSLRAAAEVFEAMIRHDEYGEMADKAYSDLGMAYLELNEPRKAKDALSQLVSKFPESPLVPLARYRIELANIQLGYGSAAQAHKALAELEQDVTRKQGAERAGMTPQEVSESVRHLEEREAEQMFRSALFYEKRGNPKGYDAALFTHRETVSRYPNTEAAQKAARHIEILESGGRPEPGIDERSFSLPGPLANLPFPRLTWGPLGGSSGKLAQEEAAEKTAEAAPKKAGVEPALAVEQKEKKGILGSFGQMLLFWKNEEAATSGPTASAPSPQAVAKVPAEEPGTGPGENILQPAAPSAGTVGAPSVAEEARLAPAAKPSAGKSRLLFWKQGEEPPALEKSPAKTLQPPEEERSALGKLLFWKKGEAEEAAPPAESPRPKQPVEKALAPAAETPLSRTAPVSDHRVDSLEAELRKESEKRLSRELEPLSDQDKVPAPALLEKLPAPGKIRFHMEETPKPSPDVAVSPLPAEPGVETSGLSEAAPEPSAPAEAIPPASGATGPAEAAPEASAPIEAMPPAIEAAAVPALQEPSEAPLHSASVTEVSEEKAAEQAEAIPSPKKPETPAGKPVEESGWTWGEDFQ